MKGRKATMIMSHSKDCCKTNTFITQKLVDSSPVVAFFVWNLCSVHEAEIDRLAVTLRISYI